MTLTVITSKAFTEETLAFIGWLFSNCGTLQTKLYFTYLEEKQCELNSVDESKRKIKELERKYLTLLERYPLD
jgi:hypothetical protein